MNDSTKQLYFHVVNQHNLQQINDEMTDGNESFQYNHLDSLFKCYYLVICPVQLVV